MDRLPLTLETLMRASIAKSMGVRTGILGLCPSQEEEEIARRKRALYEQRKMREKHTYTRPLDLPPAGCAWYTFTCPTCGHEYKSALKTGLTEEQLALRDPVPCDDCHKEHLRQSAKWGE